MFSFDSDRANLMDPRKSQEVCIASRLPLSTTNMFLYLEQVMAKYLWSYKTPWLEADIDAAVRAPDTDVFENSPFLALHVRRGDKLRHEAKIHLCEVCTERR